MKRSSPPHMPRPRRLAGKLIDFSKLFLPASIRRAFGEAFWALSGGLSAATMYSYWHSVTTFDRFARETRAVSKLRELDSAMVRRYIEWLHRQMRPDGKPWHSSTRSSAYGGIRQLLRWIQRHRPEQLGELDFARGVFPHRHASLRRRPLSPQVLRAILKACEQEIRDIRALRERAAVAMVQASSNRSGKVHTLGEVLLHIQKNHGGVVPRSYVTRNRLSDVRTRIVALGGNAAVEPCLYPTTATIFPYYLAILVQAAGNPHAIAELQIDCLQPIPLLEDHELLVWTKGRTTRQQRRAFRSADPFEPPALVRELIEWTRPIRALLPRVHRARLFVCRTHPHGMRAPSWTFFKAAKRGFSERHHLPAFDLSAIRPSVLTAVYRVSGDLHEVKEVANHAHLSTTAGYVRGPEVEHENRQRISAIQGAYLGRVERDVSGAPTMLGGIPERPGLRGAAVSMFGFDCKDAFAGIAPGSHAGELCTHFLGCFTCPNAVITGEPASLARLLQARDHLRAANGSVHPARWDVIYAPQLRILEEDILTRFSKRELAAAAPLRSALPALPELR
jgi:site-specific recombinase XerC